MTAIRAYEMDLYRRLVDGLEAIPGLTPVRDHRPRPVRRADADRGAAPRGDRAAGGRRGARRGGDRGLGRRLLRDRPDRAARPARAGRRRPDRADPLQHGGGGRPAGRRARADRGRRPTGSAVAADGRASAPDDRPMAAGRPRPTSPSSAAGSSGRRPRRSSPRPALRVRLYERIGDRRRRVRTELRDRPAPVRPGPRGPLPAVARARTGSSPTRRRPAFALPGRAGRAAVRRARRRARPRRRRRAGPRRWPETRPEVRRRRRAARARAGARAGPRRLPPGDRLPGRAGIRDRAPSPRSPPSAASRSSIGARPSSPSMAGDRVVGVERPGVRVEPAGAVVVAAGPWTPGARRPDRPLAADRPGLGRRRVGRARGAPRHGLEAIDIDDRARRATRTPRARQPPRTPLRRRRRRSASCPPPGRARSARRSSPTSPSRTAGSDALRRVGARYVPGVADAPLVGPPPLRPAGQPRRAAADRAGAVVRRACGSWPATGRGGSRPGPGSARLLVDRMLDAGTAIAAELAVDRFGRPRPSARTRRRTGRTSAATSARGARPSVRRGVGGGPAGGRPRRPRARPEPVGARPRSGSPAHGSRPASASLGVTPRIRAVAAYPLTAASLRPHRTAGKPVRRRILRGVIPTSAPRRRPQLDRAAPRRARQARPGPAFGRAYDDPAHGFLRPVDLDAAQREHDGLVATLDGLGVRVHALDVEPDTDPDLCYVFDPLLVTADGAIPLRPGKPNRRGGARRPGRLAGRPRRADRRPDRAARHRRGRRHGLAPRRPVRHRPDAPDERRSAPGSWRRSSAATSGSSTSRTGRGPRSSST